MLHLKDCLHLHKMRPLVLYPLGNQSILQLNRNAYINEYFYKESRGIAFSQRPPKFCLEYYEQYRSEVNWACVAMFGIIDYQLNQKEKQLRARMHRAR